MPSKPDTFAASVRELDRLSEAYHSESFQHNMLYKAARLLAAAGEEVRRARTFIDWTADSDHERGRENGFDEWETARATLNALAPELQENDHEG